MAIAAGKQKKEVPLTPSQMRKKIDEIKRQNFQKRLKINRSSEIISKMNMGWNQMTKRLNMLVQIDSSKAFTEKNYAVFCGQIDKKMEAIKELVDEDEYKAFAKGDYSINKIYKQQIDEENRDFQRGFGDFLG